MPKTMFNMLHASARNVIECCFGLLKQRWTIIRSPSHYSVKVTTLIMLACTLLHNFLKEEMFDDLLDAHFESDAQDADDDGDGGEQERITNVSPTNMWTAFCNHFATAVWNE
ncbi:hypothetical protein Syun_008864 [Stephania yunnanensis]|uniref:DDE Tnp4 domain-containing protein n=1 Tax=Stephania yunnanensis TaxID=152371 RepID=A0AAP0KG36_9MAGN